MKVINLWLNKATNYRLFERLAQDSAVNFLIHSDAYGQAPYLGGGEFLGPLGLLNFDEKIKYAKSRNEWSEYCFKNWAKGLSDSCIEKDMSRLSGNVLERMLFHYSQGCLDALAFQSSLVALAGRASVKLNIIIGGDYRLSEKLSLVFWLRAILSISERRNCSVDLFHVDGEKCNVKKIWDLFRDRICEGSRARASKFADSSLEGECIVGWIGGVRFPNNWDRFLRSYFSESANVVRICEKGQSQHYRSPSFEFQADTEISMYDLSELLKVPHLEIDFDKVDLIFPELGQYLIAHVSETIVKKLRSSVDVMSGVLANKKIVGGFASVAPFMESIAFLEAARNQVQERILLLPHSWTSSHEFDSCSYERTLAIISSDDVMPGITQRPGALEKEVLITDGMLEKNVDISRKNTIINKARSLRASCKGKNFLGVCNAFEKRRRLNRVRSKLRARYAECVESESFKVGLLLNAEQFEFSTVMDFGDLFCFVGEAAEIFDKSKIQKNCRLIVRRKINWTNLEFLYNRFSASAEKSNVVISPDGLNLIDYGKNCNVVLFVQGTSAVCELMLAGTPCIKVINIPGLNLNESDYVDFPQEVVPRVDLNTLQERFFHESQLNALKLFQKNWMSKRSKFNIQRHMEF